MVNGPSNYDAKQLFYHPFLERGRRIDEGFLSGRFKCWGFLLKSINKALQPYPTPSLFLKKTLILYSSKLTLLCPLSSFKWEKNVICDTQILQGIIKYIALHFPSEIKLIQNCRWPKLKQDVENTLISMFIQNYINNKTYNLNC